MPVLTPSAAIPIKNIIQNDLVFMASVTVHESSLWPVISGDSGRTGGEPWSLSGSSPMSSGRSTTRNKAGATETASNTIPKLSQAALIPTCSIIWAVNMVKTSPPMEPQRKIAPMARPRFLMNQRDATVLAPMGAGVWNTTRAAAKAR